MMMASRGTRVLAQAANRGAVRKFSAEPKLHKAKHHWTDLKAKRPVDHDDLHVRCFRVHKFNCHCLSGFVQGNSNSSLNLLPQLTFHPPYNRTTITIMATVMVAIGWGSVEMGYWHQQYKQGYWK